MDVSLSIFVGILLGSIGGWLNAIAGGGGLILIPLLIFSGMAPDIAIATNKFGTIGVILVTMYTFTKTGRTNWPFSFLLSAIAILGSYIGVKLLISVDPEILTTSVALIIILLLPLVMRSKDLGIEQIEVSKTRFTLGLFLFFLVQIYAGFFGGGAGLLIMYVMLFFFGMPIIELRATDMLPWLLGTLVSLAVMAEANIIEYSMGGGLLFGSLVGGRLGALTALKKGNKWVKKVFAVVVALSALKLFFN